jgi:hypothetical protein
MTLPVVLSSRAEASCRLLYQTLGLHRVQSSSTAGVALPQRLAPVTFDGTQVQRQATLLRLISVTEAFCTDRLLGVAENHMSPAGSPVRAAIWDKASTSSVSTWSGIESAYKSWLAVEPSWTRIRQLTEVRNSIAHGLGTLTRVQLKTRRSVVGKMSAAKVKLDGDRVLLEDENLEAACDACIELISEIDHLVQLRTGDLS